MTPKLLQLEALIENLTNWKRNRDKASLRRTHGGALDSEPLEDSIKFLTEYKQLLLNEHPH